ncbi:MAG: LamG-like jellyroll fold domain-containing protein [Actinomycetota bacterium]
MAGVHRYPPLAGAPVLLAEVVTGHHHVSLEWDDGVLGETEYRIERSPAGAGTWLEIGTQEAVAPGKAAQFTRANSEYLSIPDNPSLSMGDIDFTIVIGGVRAGSLPGLMGLVSKWQAAPQKEWAVFVHPTLNRLAFYVSPDGTAEVARTATSFGSLSIGQYYFCVAEHNAAANTTSIQVNNGTVDSGAHSTGVLDGTSPVQLGRHVTSSYLDGRLDSVGIWKRTLTAAEKTWLHNNGTARHSDDLGRAGTDGADLLTNLADWWDLEEASGTRFAAFNGNDLTDNNTVTQAEGIAPLTSTRTHTDDTVQPSTSYDYRVRAWNPAGFSAYSNTVTVLTDAMPATPSGPVLIRKDRDRASWTIDDRPVDLSDWLAQTEANGGYGAASGKLPARVVRRRTQIQQGAPIAAYLDSGDQVYEGTLEQNPSVAEGWASLKARGHADRLRENDDLLVYQDMTPAGWVDENTSPHDGTGHEGIAVRAEEGALIFEASASVVGSHGLVRWLPGAALRRLRAAIAWQGTATNYSLVFSVHDGPTGLGLADHTLSPLSASWDSGILADRGDMAKIRLDSNGGTAPFRAVIRLPRLSDITDADSFTPNNVAADVGRRSGFDVAGIPDGPPPVSYQIVQVPAPPSAAFLRKGAFVPQFTVTEVPIMTSGLNVLPLIWESAHSELLNYLAMILGWRWLAWGSAGDRPRLEFGPWGPDVRLEGEGNLDPALLHDRVVVRWQEASGAWNEHVAFPDTDPFETQRTKTPRPFVVELQGIHADSDYAEAVGEELRNLVAAPRWAGQIALGRAWQGPGRIPRYLVRAGGVGFLLGDQEGAGEPLRITHTEMSLEGVRLGVEGVASFAAVLADEEFERRRTSLGYRHNPSRGLASPVAARSGRGR